MNYAWAHSLLTNLLYLLAWAGVIGGWTACASSVEEDFTETEDESVEVCLTLNLGSGSSSRTELVDVPGTGYENYVDPNNMRVLFFQPGTSGTYLMSLEEPSIEATSDPQIYRLYGKLAKMPGSSFRVMLQLNWSALGSVSSGTQAYGICLWSGSYNFAVNKTNGYLPSASQPIPMYGIRSYSNFTFRREGQLNELGTISVIRSLAKVTVMVEGSVLTDVKMTICQQTAMSAPYNIYENTTVPTSENLNVPRSHANYGDASTVTDCPFVAMTDQVDSEGNVTTYVMYLPEYNNVANEGTTKEARISLKLDGEERELEFKDYSNPFATCVDIIRNHHYEYTVSLSKVKYSVSSWNSSDSGEITFD